MTEKGAGKKEKPIVTLIERVNMDILGRIKASPLAPVSDKNLIKYYYSKANDDGEVIIDYFYGKGSEYDGRLYSKGPSLQNFSKEIRHAIAKDKYWDIDMCNSQPTILSQYCEKTGIGCEYLNEYVFNREKILKDIQKFHKIERDVAKKMVIAIIQGGSYSYEIKDSETGVNEKIKPKKKMEYLVNLKNEAQSIMKILCSLEKTIYQKVLNDKTKSFKESTTLSIKYQEIENSCLLAMYEFLKKNYCVGALCFDGLMIEQQEGVDLTKLLENCEKYVFQKTKYKIKLTVKEMDIPLSFPLSEFSEYVLDDKGAQLQLFQIEGANKFKYCEGQLFIFDELTGMYSTDSRILDYYLVKNSKYLNKVISKDKTDNYGRTLSLMKNVGRYVEIASKNPNWLKNTQNSSIGYLLFNDGIYNGETSTHTLGFDQNIVFHKRIPHDFPPRNQEEIDYVKEVAFNKWVDNPDSLIMALAVALFGYTKVKKFYFLPGDTNAGKSQIFPMMRYAFGDYIGTFNIEELAYGKGNNKDQASKQRWSYLARFCRILISNEGTMDKDGLDGNCIKKQSSGGDSLIGRTLNKEEAEYKPHYTMFSCLNDAPKFVPQDQALENRLEYIEFPNIFVDKPDRKDPRQKQNNPDFDKIISQPKFINGLIHLMLDSYKKFLETKTLLPFDQNLKEEWTENGRQTTQVTEFIHKYFEITLNRSDTFSIHDFTEWKNRNPKIFESIGARKVDKLLESMGVKKGRNNKFRYYIGIRRKIIQDQTGPILQPLPRKNYFEEQSNYDDVTFTETKDD